MDEKNKRLVLDGNIIYPFTKQENVIGLQKTITDKLPIISEQQPQSNFVEKQVWLDTSDGTAEVIESPHTEDITQQVEHPYFQDEEPYTHHEISDQSSSGFSIDEEEHLVFEPQEEHLGFENPEINDNIVLEGGH